VRVAVVVASHERPLRLRWCLNALAEQTLAREAFEVVVVFDDRGDETAALLAAHPLRPRAIRLAAGTGTAPVQRNRGWRASRAPLVAFTDDDCRPDPSWLERLLARAGEDVVVQGATRPDPHEVHLLERVAGARTMHVEPPGPWGQTCNILYPRALLERVGGFDERFAVAGEDTDLLQRALAAGARQAAAPDAVVWHAVETPPLRARLRALRRWELVPAVVATHPQLRDGMPLRLFWKTRHATFTLALAGAAAALATRRAAPALAALPWVAEALPSYGRRPRGLARAVAELPSRALVDAVEMWHVGRGAVRARTPLL
jgi:hypothetical protein